MATDKKLTKSAKDTNVKNQQNIWLKNLNNLELMKKIMKKIKDLSQILFKLYDLNKL
jgi:hypothetical protein